MTNAWASSPSPSLDALSSESASASSALLVSWRIASTLPRRLWDAYVAYLWYYQSDSWVSRVASTFRILAVVLVLPVILLTLLDVTSYVIARTLGVVDDVKASTSDADTTDDVGRQMGTTAGAVVVPVSTARLAHGLARGSEGLVPKDSVEGRMDGDGHEDGSGHGSKGAVCAMSTAVQAPRVQQQAQTTGSGQLQETRSQTQVHKLHAGDAPPQAYYFAGEENLRLAGEGVFSPAVSMPPSPLTPRMPLQTLAEGDGRELGQVGEEEGIVLRRRVQVAKDEAVHT